MVLAGVVLPAVLAQESPSLGEVARRYRAQAGKKPAKVFTNEDLKPVDFNNGAVTGLPENAPANPGKAESSTRPAKSKAGVEQAKNSPEKNALAEKEKAPTQDAAKNEETDKKEGHEAETSLDSRNERYRAQYESKKNELTLLQRELNVLQREFNLMTADYYADAGRALRDPQDWAAKRQEYADEIASKQKQITGASQALDELKEQARRAGVSASMFPD
jgi:hypothetical protein